MNSLDDKLETKEQFLMNNLDNKEKEELMRLLSILHGSSLLDKKKDQLVDCSDDEGDDNSYHDEYIRDYI